MCDGLQSSPNLIVIVITFTYPYKKFKLIITWLKILTGRRKKGWLFTSRTEEWAELGVTKKVARVRLEPRTSKFQVWRSNHLAMLPSSLHKSPGIAPSLHTNTVIKSIINDSDVRLRAISFFSYVLSRSRDFNRNAGVESSLSPVPPHSLF